MFPDFKKQKARLTTIAVVVDVAEFEVDYDEATWVYLDDCRLLSQKLEDGLTAALAKKGYPARALPVLSTGQGADTSTSCRVFSSWAKRDLRPEDLPKMRPPFYVDSTLNATAGLQSSWREVLQATRKLKHPVRGRPVAIRVPPEVHEALGTDYAFFVVGLGTKNIVYRPVPTPGSFAGGVMSVADPSPYPGSRLQVALVDCRDGRVLWADGTSDIRAFHEKRMDDLAEKLVQRMP